jgi:hypothetical protein
MSLRAGAILAAAVALVATPPAAQATPASVAASARAYTLSIYSHYPTSDSTAPWDWEDLHTYDAGLAALIAADVRLAHGEEPAWMDADVFCQCQEDGGLAWSIASVVATGRASAVAMVNLDFGADHSLLELDLVRTTHGWRVHDIVSKAGSWRTNLARSVSGREP